MDPFSQAALGAVVGQVAGHRALGYRAAACGALAGALPDVDVLFSIGGDFVDQLILHRGITHSLFFAPVVGPVLGWLIWLRERQSDPAHDSPQRCGRWVLVITLALWSHPLLDLLTPYGTQLLLPFSNARFAVNAMPIIDPLYTLLLVTGLVLAWLPALRPRVPAAGLAALTLLVSCAYLGYGWLQGLHAEQAARQQLALTGVVPDRLAAFPTIFQVHLRRVVARDAELDRVGFYSTLHPCAISWHEAPRTNDAGTHLLEPFLATRAGSVFDWFAMGWARYDLQPQDNGYELTVSDLRYGFEDDPRISIFSLHTTLDRAGIATRAVTAGRTGPQDPEHALERLLRETYAPACRVLSYRETTAAANADDADFGDAISGDAIEAHMIDNSADQPAAPATWRE